MKISFWALSLRNKYLIISTAILFAIILYFTFDSTTKQETVIKESFTNQARVISDLLNELAITHYYYFNIEALRFLLRDIKKYHEIAHTYFLDKEGRVLTDGTKNNVHRYKHLDHKLNKLIPLANSPVQVISKSTLDVLEPIILGDEYLGALLISFSLVNMQQEIQAARTKNFLIGIILLLLFSTINYALANYIVQPIKQLTLASYAIAKGNFSGQIKTNRQDELGQLEKAFNHMAQQIKKSKDDLVKEKNYTEQIIQTINDILFVTDSKGNIKLANSAAYKHLEYEEEELLGKSIQMFQTTPLMFSNNQAIQYVSDIETHLKTKSDTTIPVWLQSSFLPENKNQDSIIWTAKNISKLKNVARALDISRNYQSAMIAAIPDEMFILTKAGMYVEVFLDKPTSEQIIGKNIMNVQFFPKEIAQEIKLKIESVAKHHLIQTMEYTLPSSKREIHYEARLTPIDDEHVLMLVRDITEHKTIEEELRYKALHDTLTGLANRANLSNILQHNLNLCKRHPDFVFSLLLLDLDGFKHVNDSLGHIAGDKMLCEMAIRLKHCVRQQDTVARLGGDEFAILLEDIESIHDAIEIAQRIQEGLTVPFFIENQEIFSSVSIGITLNTFDYNKASEMLRDADIALYRAKDNGKAQYEIFDSVLRQQAVNRLQIANELRVAIRNDCFIPHYQTIVDLKTQKIIGFEALARWQRTENYLEYPNNFIEIAEETQQITEIDYIILKKACWQIANWQKITGLELSISTNLSGHQFVRSDLVGKIEQVLEESSLEGKNLHLEITEGILLQNPELVGNILTKLKSLGIKIYLDDFGTGYSSLSYLHNFPIDTLKLDRSFIQNLQSSNSSYKIVQTIITMAHNLGVKVVAEGIETKEQLEKLQSWGCNYGQGYLFSKPLDKDNIKQLLLNSTNVS